MFTDFQYAYLTGNLFLFILWLVLFYLREDLRRKMLIMSLVVGPVGPLSQFFYLRDYWQPQLFNNWLIGFEDYMFAFLIGGVASVIYEECFAKKYAKRHLRKHRSWMLGSAVFGILLMLIGNILLGINSIYVSLIGFLVLGVVILLSRHDLLKDALYSGILVGLIMFGFYLIWTRIFPGIIDQWWMLKNISGVLVLGVPAEELMWAVAWGFVAGPAYEFINGLGFAKR